MVFSSDDEYTEDIFSDTENTHSPLFSEPDYGVEMETLNVDTDLTSIVTDRLLELSADELLEQLAANAMLQNHTIDMGARPV